MPTTLQDERTGRITRISGERFPKAFRPVVVEARP